VYVVVAANIDIPQDFLTHNILQGEVVGLSPTRVYAPSSRAVQVTGVTDLPRERELWTHELYAYVL
jgi:hypothetical protein